MKMQKEKTQEQTVGIRARKEFDKEAWKPKTDIGKKVKSGQIKDIDEILDKGIRILESEIIDILLPNLETEFVAVGQSKGKFGGGKKSVWKQTQKKTKEGSRIKFSTVVAIGNRDGYIGLGKGKARETVPAREKALYQAKLNLIKLKRGCGSWECGCGEPHTIPFKVSGKSGSVTITLLPAPKGTGLSVEEECKKILRLAGIKDVYSKTLGHTATKLNLVQSCFKALKQLNKIKVNPSYVKQAGIVSGNKK